MSKNYKTLAEKYDNFLAPAMKIRVNGAEVISELQLAVDGLELSLSLTQAGSVSFHIVNGFQLESRSFSSTVTDTFQLGGILSVEAGYGSDTTKLFHGYISEVAYEFGEQPMIRVTGLDVIRMMMDSAYLNYCYTVTSYSEAFQEVMKRYTALYDRLEVGDTSAEIKQIVQKGSDYKFVQEQLCAKAGKEFLVIGGTVYFRTPADGAEAAVSLEWGEGLISFQERKQQCSKTIRVYGRADNRKDAQMVEVTVTNEGSSSELNIVREYQNPALVGEAAIRRYANQMADRYRDKSCGGSGSCIGLPELVPGSYIKLGNLGSGEAKEYYIRSVRHSIGSSGYTTQFDVEGIRT